MTRTQAEAIRTGTVMHHARFGRVVARGSVSYSSTWGSMVWVDTPESSLAPDIPYNAHISQLEFQP